MWDKAMHTTAMKRADVMLEWGVRRWVIMIVFLLYDMDERVGQVIAKSVSQLPNKLLYGSRLMQSMQSMLSTADQSYFHRHQELSSFDLALFNLDEGMKLAKLCMSAG